VTDPNNENFCAPENVNIDFPPTDQWIRIAVQYYSNHGQTYDVHPNVKIFCNSALSAELGSVGYSPEAPVTFSAFEGAGSLLNRFWMVADVVFKRDECTNTCIVKPLYSDAGARTPLLTNAQAAGGSFGPAYPPLP
jgi:hypothetical protein